MRTVNLSSALLDHVTARESARDSWRKQFDFDEPEPSSEEVDRLAFHRTAQVLAQIGRVLTDHSSHSAAVAVALGLHEVDGGNMAQIGERLGMSKQAVAKHVTGLRTLFGASLPYRNRTKPLIRPDASGRWLTRAELRREFHIDTERADRMGCRTLTPEGNLQRQKFWSAEHLHELLDAQAVAEAIERARAVDAGPPIETKEPQ
jgi:hypothetical protein